MSLEDLIVGDGKKSGALGGGGASDGDPDGGDPNTKTKPQLEAEMIAQIRRQAEAEISARMLADPDVSALLAAKREGRKIKMIPLSDKGELPEGFLPSQQRQEQEPEIDLESLDNASLVKHLNKQFETRTRSLLQQQQEMFEQKLAGLQSHVVETKQRSIDDQIDLVKRRYAKENDFEKLEPDMARLARQAPGLDVEELYLLAKRRNLAKEGKLPHQLQQRTQSESERPSVAAVRPAEWTPNDSVPSGHDGFKQILQEALSKKEIPAY